MRIFLIRAIQEQIVELGESIRKVANGRFIEINVFLRRQNFIVVMSFHHQNVKPRFYAKASGLNKYVNKYTQEIDSQVFGSMSPPFRLSKLIQQIDNFFELNPLKQNELMTSVRAALDSTAIIDKINSIRTKLSVDPGQTIEEVNTQLLSFKRTTMMLIQCLIQKEQVHATLQSDLQMLSARVSRCQSELAVGSGKESNLKESMLEELNKTIRRSEEKCNQTSVDSYFESKKNIAKLELLREALLRQ